MSHAERPLRNVRLATLYWSNERRGALLSAMQRGLAVFAYRDKSAELIAPCWIAGRYTFVDVEADREIVAVRRDASHHGPGNDLGTRSVAPLPLVQLTMTGSWRTLVPQESRRYLEGACANATHVAGAVNVGYADTVSRAPPPEPGRLHSATRSPTEARSSEVLDIVLTPLSVEFTIDRGEPSSILPRQSETADVVMSDGLCDPSDFSQCTASCASGNARSCHNLALLLGYRSPGAITLLQAACDRRVPEACYALGWAYQTTWQDYPELRKLYEVACTGGVGIACSRAAPMFSERPQGPEWMQRSFPFYLRSCLAGDASACKRVAFEHDRQGRAVEAVELYARACRAGSLPSCERWANLLEEHRIASPNRTLAEDLHRFACSRSHIKSCVLLEERGLETGDSDFRPQKP